MHQNCDGTVMRLQALFSARASCVRSQGIEEPPAHSKTIIAEDRDGKRRWGFSRLDLESCFTRVCSAIIGWGAVESNRSFSHPVPGKLPAFSVRPVPRKCRRHMHTYLRSQVRLYCVPYARRAKRKENCHLRGGEWNANATHRKPRKIGMEKWLQRSTPRVSFGRPRVRTLWIHAASVASRWLDESADEKRLPRLLRRAPPLRGRALRRASGGDKVLLTGVKVLKLVFGP